MAVMLLGLIRAGAKAADQAVENTGKRLEAATGSGSKSTS
jgi:hypothetical protein